MSPAVLRIQTSQTTRGPARFEAFPPWLVSTIVHMVAVIVLGLLHISTPPGSSLRLLFVPTQDIAEAVEPDTSDLADIDVTLEAEPLPINLVEDAPAELSDQDMLTSFEANLSDIMPAPGGATSLVTGLGEGTIGELAAGDKGYASLFGLSGEGGKFVYVFDRSESMNSVFSRYSEGRLISVITPLQSAKQELVRSLNSLSSSSEFQIVFYNDSPYTFGESHYSEQLYPATEEHKEHARAFIEQMRGQGFTNHLSAVEVAIGLEPDVIFLLTDAEAKDDLHPNVVRQIAKYCGRHNIVINVVHFCSVARPECTLVWLAEKTGGEHIFISLESLAESTIGSKAY